MYSREGEADDRGIAIRGGRFGQGTAALVAPAGPHDPVPASQPAFVFRFEEEREIVASLVSGM
jgi:hypothetical protein